MSFTCGSFGNTLMAMAQKERGRKERPAHWLQNTRGHRVLQRGQFMET